MPGRNSLAGVTSGASQLCPAPFVSHRTLQPQPSLAPGAPGAVTKVPWCPQERLVEPSVTHQLLPIQPGWFWTRPSELSLLHVAFWPPGMTQGWLCPALVPVTQGTVTQGTVTLTRPWLCPSSATLGSPSTPSLSQRGACPPDASKQECGRALSSRARRVIQTHFESQLCPQSSRNLFGQGPWCQSFAHLKITDPQPGGGALLMRQNHAQGLSF